MIRRAVMTMAPVFLVAAAVFVFQYTRPAAAQDGTPVAAGRELYLTGCSTCHGRDGTGTALGPTLVGVGAAAADFQLSTGRMPAANGTNRQATRKRPAYTPDQIDALVAFVASLGPGPAIPVVDTAGADLAAGGGIYRTQCAACHNAAGVGGALSYGRHAPALNDATAVQVVEAMRVGPGQMPVFNEQTIGDADATNVAAYVGYLRSPRDRGGISLGRVGPVTEGFVALLFGLGGLCLLGVWIVGRSHA